MASDRCLGLTQLGQRHGRRRQLKSQRWRAVGDRLRSARAARQALRFGRYELSCPLEQYFAADVERHVNMQRAGQRAREGRFARVIRADGSLGWLLMSIRATRQVTARKATRLILRVACRRYQDVRYLREPCAKPMFYMPVSG